MSKVYDTFDEDLAEVLTSKFLRKYAWIIEPARRHSVNLFLMQDIVELLEELPNLKKEGSSVHIGLVLEGTHTKFEKSLFQKNPFHISKRFNFLHLKNAVDGRGSAYILDRKGMVRIERLPLSTIKTSPQETLFEFASRYTTLSFYIGATKSEIYDSGKLLQINRKGIWIKPPSMLLIELEEQGFPFELTGKIFGICVTMSEMYEGGTFVITTLDSVQYCSPMLTDCEFRKCPIDKLAPNELIEFAKIDGAIILDTRKEIIAIGQKLEPPLETLYSKEGGRGTRHNSAAKYSNAVLSLVFVVSEDGPVSLYFRGNLHSRCFDELFGS